jgi:uncharacterized membrane protein YphA (DoxX/SURF4 family)
MNAKLHAIKVISRTALGLVWFYEGLVPKILFLRADELDLVQASHLVWRTPQLTLQILGVAQMLVGLWLIIGFAERTAVLIATSWMLILIVLVASGNPSMLIDPYGALVKDFCLIACAITVWTLAPCSRDHAVLSREQTQVSARTPGVGPKASRTFAL